MSTDAGALLTTILGVLLTRLALEGTFRRYVKPAMGPWIAVGKAGCASGEHGCTTAIAVVRAVVAGLSAVAQVGGLAVAAEAAFVPSAARTPAPATKATITPLFFAGRDQITLGVSGEF